TTDRPIVSFRYQVQTADLRSPIRATWRSAGAQIAPLSSSGDSVLVTLVLRNVQRGQTIVQNISVDVTDTDGVTASASTPLTISVLDPDHMPDPLPRPPRKQPDVGFHLGH